MIENNAVNEKDCLEKLPKSVEYPAGVSYINQLYSTDGIAESRPNDLRDPEPVRNSPLGRSRTPTGQMPYNRNSILKENMKRNDKGIDQSTQHTSRFKGAKRHYRTLKSPNMTSYDPLISKKGQGNKELRKSILKSRRSIIGDYSSQCKPIAKLPILNGAKGYLSERNCKREEQLNTFNIPHVEDSDEIEEVIETEEKAIRGRNCMTPLYLLLFIIGKEV
jgi:hypothetical protein